MLFERGAIPLPDQQGCFDPGKNGTVGDFLKNSLVFASGEKKARTWVKGSCESLKVTPEIVEFFSDGEHLPKEMAAKIKTLAGKNVWDCSTGVGHADGENHWSREVKFLATESDRKVIVESLRCPNTP